MTNHYILRNWQAVPCENLEEWARWYGAANRTIAKDTIGDVTVRTVFLAIDYRYREGPPILFETMVFGGILHGEQDRCSTYEQALDMHHKMMERLRAIYKNKDMEQKVVFERQARKIENGPKVKGQLRRRIVIRKSNE